MTVLSFLVEYLSLIKTPENSSCIYWSSNCTSILNWCTGCIVIIWDDHSFMRAQVLLRITTTMSALIFIKLPTIQTLAGFEGTATCLALVSRITVHIRTESYAVMNVETGATMLTTVIRGIVGTVGLAAFIAVWRTASCTAPVGILRPSVCASSVSNRRTTTLTLLYTGRTWIVVEAVGFAIFDIVSPATTVAGVHRRVHWRLCTLVFFVRRATRFTSIWIVCPSVIARLVVDSLTTCLATVAVFIKAMDWTAGDVIWRTTMFTAAIPSMTIISISIASGVVVKWTTSCSTVVQIYCPSVRTLSNVSIAQRGTTWFFHFTALSAAIGIIFSSMFTFQSVFTVMVIAAPVIIIVWAVSVLGQLCCERNN